MVKHVIECDFWSFKMAAVCHFMRKKKLRIDLKWREMRFKAIFGHPRWPPVAICENNSKKIKVAYFSQMARNVRVVKQKWPLPLLLWKRPFLQY